MTSRQARSRSFRSVVLFGALVGATLTGACSGKSDNKAAVDAGAPAVVASFTPAFARAWPAAESEVAIREGKAVIAKHQCNRCHAIDDITTADRPLNCTGCHVWMKGMKAGDADWTRLVAKYGEDVMRRYQKNIQHLERVPDLTAIARRLKPTWIGAFLSNPQDLRPALEESMPRHKLEAAEIETLVKYFAAVAGVEHPRAAAEPAIPAADAATIEAGKQLFLTRGCPTCHTFGNLATGVSEAALASALPGKLAPNLRFTRERMDRSTAISWIVEPTLVAPTTLMPKMPVSRDDAEKIVAFLWGADPQLAPKPSPPAPFVPAILDRKVGYDEMKEKVLGKVCVHCHMNDYERDNGPGNRGGLGYKGIQLRMRTYETLVTGAIDAKGARYSVLIPAKGETQPPILQAMIRRRTEEQRDRLSAFHDAERPEYPAGLVGMPLGLPSMTDEEMSILATWIAQGCEGPERVTGMAGVWDGYLIPDGPIEKNKGCELRMPAAKRPAWAVDAVTEGVVPPAGSSSAKPSSSGAAPAH